MFPGCANKVKHCTRLQMSSLRDETGQTNVNLALASKQQKRVSLISLCHAAIVSPTASTSPERKQNPMDDPKRPMGTYLCPAQSRETKDP